MNEPCTADQTNRRFAEAVRDFAAPVPRKWSKLLTLQPGIAELRRKGASYQTITDILRAADVPVSRTTVARFCRDVLEFTPRTSRPRKASARTVKQQLSSSPKAHRISKTDSSPATKCATQSVEIDM